MADSAIRPEDLEVQSVKDGISALAQLNVTVVRAEQPIEPDFSRILDKGYATAVTGLATVTATGHVLVELFAGDDDINLQLGALTEAERLVTTGFPGGSRYLGCTLTDEYALQLLSAKILREQLDEVPGQCRVCGGRMSKQRHDEWLHAKCDQPATLRDAAERRIRWMLATAAACERHAQQAEVDGDIMRAIEYRDHAADAVSPDQIRYWLAVDARVVQRRQRSTGPKAQKVGA